MKMHDKISYLIKHNSAVQMLYRVIMSTFFKIIGLFIKTDDSLLLISSYGGKQYSDSPKVLYEAMLKDSRFQNFRFVWAFEHPNQHQPEHASCVKMDSLQYFITALKAKIWITNVNMERGLNFKKKSTIYLNSWHGTGPKKGGNAVKGRKDYNFSRVDIFCCDGQYTHDVFMQWFNATESSMLWCGRPREDELLQLTESDRSRIRKSLGIPNDKKMILYMPTWREYGNKALAFECWKKELKDEFVMCVRMHHFTVEDFFKSEQDHFWFDVTDYPNINELYVAADLLISDYSSAFFDYGLLGKPIYCYAYDYDRYEREYGLFMDLEHEFPNGVYKNELDLIHAIKHMDYHRECENSKQYCDRYVSHPVNATERCLNEIYRRLEEKQ